MNNNDNWIIADIYIYICLFGRTLVLCFGQLYMLYTCPRPLSTQGQSWAWRTSHIFCGTLPHCKYWNLCLFSLISQGTVLCSLPIFKLKQNQIFLKVFGSKSKAARPYFPKPIRSWRLALLQGLDLDDLDGVPIWIWKGLERYEKVQIW